MFRERERQKLEEGGMVVRVNALGFFFTLLSCMLLDIHLCPTISSPLTDPDCKNAFSSVILLHYVKTLLSVGRNE